MLDKILHSRREIAPTILRRPDVRCLFLVREPKATIASTVNLARAMGGIDRYCDPTEAIAY